MILSFQFDSLGDHQQLADVLASYATVAAVALGGVWTWFALVRSRELDPRGKLDLEVSVSEPDQASCTISFENVGPREVRLIKESCSLEIFVPHAELDVEDRIQAMPIFEKTASIGMNEVEKTTVQLRREDLMNAPSLRICAVVAVGRRFKDDKLYRSEVVATDMTVR